MGELGLKKIIAALALLVLPACETVPVDGNASVVRENPGATRALRSCPRAIVRETGASGITLNTDIVIVEINQYIFDVPGQDRPWTCITDDAGAAQFIYPTRVIS